jgi:ribonuclease VapC
MPSSKVYVLDANALIRYVKNGVGADKVEGLMRRVVKREAQLLISVVNWGEALYVMARQAGFDHAAADMKALRSLIETVPTDEAVTEAAASLKFRYKLGYADSFAAALALRTKATLVTADPEFAKLGKQLKVLALPRHAA